MSGEQSNEEESFHTIPSHHLSNAHNEQSPPAIATYIQPAEISDDDLRLSVRTLNTEQREAYDMMLTRCRNKVKSMNSVKPEKVQPIYLFITGGAVAGKSYLIKTIYHTYCS